MAIVREERDNKLSALFEQLGAYTDPFLCASSFPHAIARYRDPKLAALAGMPSSAIAHVQAHVST